MHMASLWLRNKTDSLESCSQCDIALNFRHHISGSNTKAKNSVGYAVCWCGRLLDEMFFFYL